MTQYYLLNQVVVGQGVTRFPGELIDDTLEGTAMVAAIRAGGGALVLATDPGAAAAAALIGGSSGLRVRGAPLAALAAIMTGAIAAELQVSATTASGWVDLPLTAFREVDANNAVGNIAANGGILASDTTPVLGASSKLQIITWATGNVDPISIETSLPPDFDGTADATIDFWVLSGTTDAASLNVQTIWDATAAVSDDVDDSATKSATRHKVTATIAAADIPDAAATLGVMLTPPAHATNTIVLSGARLNYKRKLLAA